MDAQLTNRAGNAKAPFKVGSDSPSESDDVDMPDAFRVMFKAFDKKAPTYITDALEYFKYIEGGGLEFAELIRRWQLFEAEKGYPSSQVSSTYIPSFSIAIIADILILDRSLTNGFRPSTDPRRFMIG